MRLAFLWSKYLFQWQDLYLGALSFSFQFCGFPNELKSHLISSNHIKSYLEINGFHERFDPVTNDDYALFSYEYDLETTYANPTAMIKRVTNTCDYYRAKKGILPMSYFEFIEDFVDKEKERLAREMAEFKSDDVTMPSKASTELSFKLFHSTPRRNSSIEMESPKLSEIANNLSGQSLSCTSRSFSFSRGPLSFFREEICELVSAQIKHWLMDSSWDGNVEELVVKMTDVYFEDEKICHLASEQDLAYIVMSEKIASRIKYRLNRHLAQLNAGI